MRAAGGTRTGRQEKLLCPVQLCRKIIWPIIWGQMPYDPPHYLLGEVDAIFDKLPQKITKGK